MYVTFFMFLSVAAQCPSYFFMDQVWPGHIVHVMNSLYFDRGNSVCWWHFPNASGPREGLPCCSTQGVFPDQDFSPQRGPQGRDLCQCAEEGLEGRTRPPTCLTCKVDRLIFDVQLCYVYGLIHFCFFPALPYRQSSVFSYIRIRNRL